MATLHERLELLRQYQDHGTNLNTRTIYIGDEINESSAEKAIKALDFLESESLEDIKILLNSSGGEDYSGLAIYDAIKNSSCFITIIGLGSIMSMASLVLQAGDHRALMPNSTMMLHVGYASIQNEHNHNLIRESKEIERLIKLSADIYLARMKEKNAELTKKDIDNLLQFNTYITAKGAVNMGLADEVL
jgi:ATP-dependent Clp protease, protease subunit